MPDSLTIPSFIDTFNPSAIRAITLAHITALRMDLAGHAHLEESAPRIASWTFRLREEIKASENYINSVLPHMLTFRRLIRELVSIDDRLSFTLPTDSLSLMSFISLRGDESYRDFKLVAGKIVLKGWKLTEGKVDHTFGSVDFKFCFDALFHLQIVVKPGDSATCQIQEKTELREVTVKKIVCDGVETGEMSDAKLTAPNQPAVEPPAPSLPESSDDLPF